MKLFLTKLGSCWQSTNQLSVSELDQSEKALINPQPKRRSSSTHWRPALTVISEDNCATAFVVCGGGNDDERRKTKLIDKEKPRQHHKSVKARVKPSSSYNSDLDSCWKVQAQMAIPAFSPTPFMF